MIASFCRICASKYSRLLEDEGERSADEHSEDAIAKGSIEGEGGLRGASIAESILAYTNQLGRRETWRMSRREIGPKIHESYNP